MTSQIVNYTQEQTTELVTKYLAGSTVQELAELLQRSTRSIVAKLSREGVYVAQTKNKTGHKRESKLEIVTKLAEKIGCDPKALETLQKANSEALALISGWVDKQ